MFDERDERAHEHEHGERKGKGHVQEPQSQPDEHRVDCRDDRGSATKPPSTSHALCPARSTACRASGVKRCKIHAQNFAPSRRTK